MESVRTRDLSWSCRHSSRIMHFLECVFKLDIYWTILHCLGQDMLVLDKFCIWVELPVQRRLCPIFVKNVRSPDIHEYFAG